MSRLALALPLAVLLLAAPVYAESAAEHVTAAKKAQGKKQWKKALEEWRAAYRLDPNADYLLAMGDAYAKLGDKANAKSEYEAYLAEPLASNTDAVKAKIAALEKGGGDDLSLDLSGPAAAPPAAAAAPAGDLGLDLSGPTPPASAKGKKKGKKDKGEKPATEDLGLDLAPAAPPAPQAKNDASKDLELGPPPSKQAANEPKKGKGDDLPFDLGPPQTAKQTKPTAVATNTPPPATKPPPATTPPTATPPKETPPAVAVATPPPSTKPAPPPFLPPPPATTAKTTTVPPEALAANNNRYRESSGGGSNKIVGYTVAGGAAIALALSGLYYSKSSSDASSLHGSISSGAQKESVLGDEKLHKSLSFAGLTAGLVLAGVATAIFVF